jgi:hypothetical protein
MAASGKPAWVFAAMAGNPGRRDPDSMSITQATTVVPGWQPSPAARPVQPPVQRLLAGGRVRGALAMLGPAFVASVAYVDPGNWFPRPATWAMFVRP